MFKFVLVCLSTLFLINYQFQTCDGVTTTTVNTIHNRVMCNLIILSYWVACLVSGGSSDQCSAINIQHQKVPQCNVCNSFLVFWKIKNEMFLPLIVHLPFLIGVLSFLLFRWFSIRWSLWMSSAEVCLWV